MSLLRSIERYQLKLGDPSAKIENYLRLVDKNIDWQWALEELEEGLSDQRVEIRPNGGYVVNGMKPQHHHVNEAARMLQRADENRIVKTQMYIATTIHSGMFGKHTDFGQDSIIIQGQGRTAVDVGGQYGILEPGDMMYLRASDKHRFTSLGPRFSITLSLEEDN